MLPRSMHQKQMLVLNRMLAGETLEDAKFGVELRSPAIALRRELKAEYKKSMRNGGIIVAIFLILLKGVIWDLLTGRKLGMSLSMMLGTLSLFLIFSSIPAWLKAQSAAKKLRTLEQLAARFEWWAHDGPARG